MKNQKKEKIKQVVKSITIGILDSLLAIAENFVITMDRHEVYKTVYGYRENEWSFEKISKYFSSLKHRGYLEFERVGGKESIRFTNKAKLALLDKISARKAEEEKYYFVSFDIPERLRINRDSFRRTIKRLGFREIQKSLWACKKGVGEFVEMAAEEYKVSDYVIYLVTDITNVNENLDKMFGKQIEVINNNPA